MNNQPHTYKDNPTGNGYCIEGLSTSHGGVSCGRPAADPVHRLMTPLTSGEIRTTRVNGVAISMFQIAGGGFTTVAVRTYPGGLLVETHTVPDEARQLARYARLVERHRGAQS